VAGINDVLDGKYRLLRPLKRGSMGAVFAAENLSLGVPVAVKVVRADVRPEAKEELAERMVQEAHAAFQVDHPAILRVLDVGTTPRGDPYVVMEMLRGETLAGAMKDNGPVGPAQSLRVLMPIAHALVTAHACKVVHRDIKPSNVFLARTSDGRIQPKLIDFGLAKALLPSRKRLTQEGNTMGSPAYMAPEQIRGEDVTGQADVWGFCVTLYEMITGEIPFEARELEVLFTRILFDPPKPLREHGVPDEELWAIINKGLKKDPEQRWANMRQLGAALAEWLVDRDYHDDVCCSALRSTWLEPRRSPGKIDLLATAPIPMRRRPSRIRLPSLSELSTGKWQRVRGGHRSRAFWVLLVLLATGVAGAVASYHGMTWTTVKDHWSRTWSPAKPGAPSAEVIVTPALPTADSTSHSSDSSPPPAPSDNDDTTLTDTDRATSVASPGAMVGRPVAPRPERVGGQPRPRADQPLAVDLDDPPPSEPPPTPAATGAATATTVADPLIP